MSGPADPLRDELGVASPAGLSPDDAGDLARLVRKARDRQRRELREAIDEAYRHIPRLMRGPIRRILGG